MNFIVHVMSTDLWETDKENIKLLACELRIKIVLYQIDEMFFKNFPSQVHLPIPTYFRFLLPLLVDAAQVLYLDADIICRQDIRSLFAISLDNCVIAAAPDHPSLGAKRNDALGLSAKHCYFNAGILLIDIKKWNEWIIVDKVMAALTAAPEKFRYLDQDALNLILTGKVRYLDRKWNHLNNIEEGQTESIFLHFAAHPKPWNIAWPLSPLCTDFTRDLYRQYEQLTPFKDMPLEMPGNYKEMKIYAKCLWRSGQYAKSLLWQIKYIKNKLGV